MVEVLDRFGSVAFLLFPVSGSVTIDRTNSFRRTCEFKVMGSLASVTPPGQDLKTLLPYGTEVRISRGIEFIDGSQEFMRLGIFRITDTQTDLALEDGIGISFQGTDRAERLSRELLAPFDAPVESNYGNVIVALLQQAWTGASTTISSPDFRITSTDHLTPVLHFEEKSNPWEEAKGMATSCGKELFVDYDGTVCFDDLPSIDSDPVWDFSDNSTTDTRIRLSRRYSSTSTPNYITVNGTNSNQNTEANITGVAFITDPTTSIDINGEYGTVPKWVDSVYVTSNEQAADQARAELAKVLAGTDVLEVDAIPNPFLDVGDVVTVTSDPLNIYGERYIINTITMPLDIESPMHLTLGRG